MRATDNVELLLRDTPPKRLELGRKIATFARLMSADARHAPAASVRVNLDRAREELDEHVRRRLLNGLVDLARHHVYAALGPDSFLWLGEIEATAQAAWSALEEHRDELPWLCSVTEPNEDALRVTERVLAAAARLGLSSSQRRLWSARLARAEFGAERGESAFRELFADALKPDGSRSLARAALAGAVECLLDRGALRAARTALDDAREVVGDDRRLRRLLAWVCLVQDDEAGLRAAELGQPEWRDRVPLALAELRQRRPSWLPFLSGRAPAASSTAALAHAEAPSRRTFGATLLAVFAAESRGGHSVVELDVAPGLRGRVADWLRDRESACLEPEEPEHRMVIAGRDVAVHRHGVQPLRGTISPSTVRSVVLAPIHGEQGELDGWLRMEFEHHLVPAQIALVRAALAWRARVLAHRRERGARRATAELRRAHSPAMDVPGGGRGAARASLDMSFELPARPGPCASVFRELVAQLGMKTAQRHWWGFQVRGERAELVAEGGAPLGERTRAQPGGRAVLRALMSAGLVRFDDPSAEMALDANAGSGLVLPLIATRRLCGLLAVESSRRKDFPESHCERLLERCRAAAPELRVAQFREWHIERFGHDVRFAAASPSVPLDDVFACGRSRAPTSIVGPAGSGKQVLARWLHFESGRGDEPFVVFACGSDDAELFERASSSRGSVLARARHGTLVLDDVERLSERAQVRLLEAFDDARAPSDAPRWIATSRAPLAEAAARGELRLDLCERLRRLQLELPPLSRRRGDVPALIASFAQRFAADEGLPAPSLSDDAIALLWRQPWPGNLRQLESFVYKIVLLHAGREATGEQLEQLAARFQFDFVARVPSRAPDAETVRAALETTANQRGSVNKTRAALYLGWDPDTLTSRMSDLGLSAGASSSESAPPPVS